MNVKHKYLVTSLRILFGLFIGFSGISGLMMLASGSMEGVPEDMVAPTQFLIDSGIFHLVKIAETIAGVMLIFNFLPALAVLFLAPITIGILMVQARLTPSFIVVGLIVALFEAYFGYVYWDKYKGLFKRK